jgi:hypothetical protein
MVRTVMLSLLLLIMLAGVVAVIGCGESEDVSDQGTPPVEVTPPIDEEPPRQPPGVGPDAWGRDGPPEGE